jgi:hypothetical protein
VSKISKKVASATLIAATSAPFAISVMGRQERARRSQGFASVAIRTSGCVPTRKQTSNQPNCSQTVETTARLCVSQCVGCHLTRELSKAIARTSRAVTARMRSSTQTITLLPRLGLDLAASAVALSVRTSGYKKQGPATCDCFSRHAQRLTYSNIQITTQCILGVSCRQHDRSTRGDLHVLA